jgi:hypothetical protein
MRSGLSKRSRSEIDGLREKATAEVTTISYAAIATSFVQADDADLHEPGPLTTGRTGFNIVAGTPE